MSRETRRDEMMETRALSSEGEKRGREGFYGLPKAACLKRPGVER